VQRAGLWRPARRKSVPAVQSRRDACLGRLVATVAATTVTASSAGAATAAAAVLPWPRLIDRQSASLDLLAITGLDGRLSLRVATDSHDANSFGPAGVAVHDDLRRLHGAVPLEELC